MFLAGCSGSTLPQVQEDSKAPIGAHSATITLSGEALGDPQGVINGGRFLSAEHKTRTHLELPNGRYQIDVQAHTSPYDGAAGKLLVLGNQRELGTLSFPENNRTLRTLQFELEGWRGLSLETRFTNDAYDPTDGRDRNLLVDFVRISPVQQASPVVRSEAIRHALKNANLLLISLDTLRADHLSAYGYPENTSPHIDAMAAAGVRFSNAISASHWTAPSHATMLTGLHPEQHGITQYPTPGKLAESIETLGERMANAGYQTGWFADGGYVSEKLGFAKGFEHRTETFVTAEERFSQVSRWIESLDSDRPWFAFVHTFQIHDPYAPPTQSNLGHIDLNQLPSPQQLQQLIALYDAEIKYTDKHLGLLLDAVDQQNTLIILTSDHGEAFMEHGQLQHSSLHGELLRVPLIFSHPILKFAALDAPDQIAPAVHLVPTVLDLLSLPSDETLPGNSLLPPMTGQPTPTTAYASSRMFRTQWSALDRQGHYIEDGAQKIFYDLRTDKGEQTPRTAPARYAQTLQKWKQDATIRAAPSIAENFDEHEVLKLLGYVE